MKQVLNKLSPPQMAYVQARARYDSLEAQVKEIIGECPTTDEAIDAYCGLEVEVRVRLGCMAAHQVLLRTEEALLEWGHQMVKVLPQYAEQRVGMEHLFGTRLLKFRQRVIDLCLQIDASAATKVS